MTIKTIDTAVENSGFIFFEKTFLGTTGVPRSIVMSHLCAPLINCLFKCGGTKVHNHGKWSFDVRGPYGR